MRGVYIIWLRQVKLYVRSKSRIIGTLGMPLFFLIIMGVGLSSAFQDEIGMDYMAFIAPGIIAMSMLFTTVFSGVQIIADKQFGFIKETLVAPVSRFQIILGQTFGGATAALIQGFMILIISLFIGATISSFVGFLIAVLFMILIGIGFAAMSIVFATPMKDMQGFHLVMNFLIFPIFLLSGAFFPLEGLPSWLKFLTYMDPLTYGVEGIRFGLLGTSQISPIISFFVLVVFSIVMILVGSHLLNKIKV